MNDLTLVRQELRSRIGMLRRVADETGIPYDTILRIKNEEGDPGFAKVAILATYFRDRAKEILGEL